jgi:hypothetical protein
LSSDVRALWIALAVAQPAASPTIRTTANTATHGRFIEALLPACESSAVRKAYAGSAGNSRPHYYERTSVLQSFAEPILGFFEQARKLIGRSSCEPFYTGSVPHPN